jgi:hypothetical protein
MNCPSRTDDTLPHCDWNQNPPFLAPDLTTRQDLNGISNVREFKEGAGIMGSARHCLHDADLPSSHKSQCDAFRSLHPGASLTLSGKLHRNLTVGRRYMTDQLKTAIINALTPKKDARTSIWILVNPLWTSSKAGSYGCSLFCAQPFSFLRVV